MFLNASTLRAYDTTISGIRTGFFSFELLVFSRRYPRLEGAASSLLSATV
jgi:hypothetical protein